MIYLEAEIRRLEAEFNMFFAGRLPRPPWETRAKVNALVKKHDQSFIRNTADRFRFESLQNRYQKFPGVVGTADDESRAGAPDHGQARVAAAEREGRHDRAKGKAGRSGAGAMART